MTATANDACKNAMLKTVAPKPDIDFAIISRYLLISRHFKKELNILPSMLLIKLEM